MVIEIPDNATNGEVVKAVFSEISKDEKYPVVYQFNKTTNRREMLCDLFDDIWWNEPYCQNNVNSTNDKGQKCF